MSCNSNSLPQLYVAAVAVQLDLEGVLSLDDPAADWVSEAPHGERYTLRQVLGHQSGLAARLTAAAPRGRDGPAPPAAGYIRP